MWFFLVIIGVIAALLFYVSRKPDAFRVERRILISAPPEKIYPYIADFHNWTQWSPYEKLDANLQRSYGGAASGVGATYAYEGNNKVGAGRMEIVEAQVPTRVLTRLEFLKPMAATNTAEFSFLPTGNGTEVTWAMFGNSPFMAKLMGTVFNIDKLVGSQFEEGLANLKAVSEKQA